MSTSPRLKTDPHQSAKALQRSAAASGAVCINGAIQNRSRHMHPNVPRRADTACPKQRDESLCRPDHATSGPTWSGSVQRFPVHSAPLSLRLGSVAPSSLGPGSPEGHQHILEVIARVLRGQHLFGGRSWSLKTQGGGGRERGRERERGAEEGEKKSNKLPVPVWLFHVFSLGKTPRPNHDCAPASSYRYCVKYYAMIEMAGRPSKPSL